MPCGTPAQCVVGQAWRFTSELLTTREHSLMRIEQRVEMFDPVTIDPSYRIGVRKVPRIATVKGDFSESLGACRRWTLLDKP